jgi:hypothetical protein
MSGKSIKALQVLLTIFLLLGISTARDLIFKLNPQTQDPIHNNHHKKGAKDINFASRGPGSTEYVYETLQKVSSLPAAGKIYLSGNEKPYNLVFDTTSAGVLVFGPNSINNNISKTYTCAHPYCKIVREDPEYIKDHYRHHGSCPDNKVELNGSIAITGMRLEHIEIKECEIFIASKIQEARNKIMADGNIGLQPISGPIENNFLKILKKSGFIQKQVFSFFFDKLGRQSFIIIGEEQPYFSQEDFTTYQRVNNFL